MKPHRQQQHHSCELKSRRKNNQQQQLSQLMVNNKSAASTEGKQQAVIDRKQSGSKQDKKREGFMNAVTSRISSKITRQKQPSNCCKWHVIVSLITLALYYNSLFAELVYDDSAAIINNPDVIGHHEAGSSQLGSSETVGEWLNLWFNDYWGTNIDHSGSHKSYRPLVVLTFKLNHLIHGLAPFGYHLVNLVLHLLVCNLILLLTSRLLSDRSMLLAANNNSGSQIVPNNNNYDNDNDQSEVARFNCNNNNHSNKYNSYTSATDNNNRNNECNYNRRCLVATMLFVCHPIHVEAVTSVVGRAELLGTLMFLISFNYYIQYCESRSTVAIAGTNVRWFSARTSSLAKSLFAAAMALLCKENTITVFAVNATYDIVHQLKPSSPSIEQNQQKQARIAAASIRCKKGNSANKKASSSFHCFGLLCLLIVSAILILFRILIMNGLPMFSKADNPIAANQSFLTRLLTFAYLPYFNLLLLLYPKTLSFDWSTEYISPIERCNDLRLVEIILFYSTLLWVSNKIANHYYIRFKLLVVKGPSNSQRNDNDSSSKQTTKCHYKKQQQLQATNNLNHCLPPTSSFTNFIIKPTRQKRTRTGHHQPLKQIENQTSGNCIGPTSFESFKFTHKISINNDDDDDDTKSIAFDLEHHSSNRHDEELLPKSSSPCSLSSFISSGSSDHELDNNLNVAPCSTTDDHHYQVACAGKVVSTLSKPPSDDDLKDQYKVYSASCNLIASECSISGEEDSGLDIVLEEEDSENQMMWSGLSKRNNQKLSFEEKRSSKDREKIKHYKRRGLGDIKKEQNNIKLMRDKVKLKLSTRQQQQQRQQTSSSDGLYWSEQNDDPGIEQLTLGMAIMTVTFLPSSNLLFYVGFVIAERTLYLPSLGFCILIALAIECVFKNTEWKMVPLKCHYLKDTVIFNGLLSKISHTSASRINQICLSVILVPVLLSASYRTVLRNTNWFNEQALYSSDLEVSPAKAANNLATFYTKMSKFDAAEHYFKMALSYRPNMADAHYNLGRLYHQQRRYDQAVDRYKKAIKYRPTLSIAYLNLGIIYEKQYKLSDSERIYLQCANLSDHKLKDPIGHRLTQISCLVNLAKQYLDYHDRSSETIELLRHRALYHDQYLEQNNYRLSPRINLLASIHNLMGEAYRKLKQDSLCEKHFKLASSLDGQDASTQIRVAKNLFKEAKIQEAKSVLLRALSKAIRYDLISQANLRYHYADILYKELAAQNSQLNKKPMFDADKNNGFDILQPVFDQLKIAHEMQPDNYNIASFLADIFRQSNKHLEAEQLYAKCVLIAKTELNQLSSSASSQVDPKKQHKFKSILASSHSNYGAILQLVGKLHEAKEEYSEALAIDQHYSLARENLKNINDLISKRSLASQRESYPKKHNLVNK